MVVNANINAGVATTAVGGANACANGGAVTSTDAVNIAAGGANANINAGANPTACAGASSALAAIGAGSLIAASDAAGAPLSVPIPFQNKIVLIEDTRIAGTTHVHGIDAIVEGLEIDSELRLEREPGNLADTWAIRVFSGEQRIGYVPADCNEVLARLMDGGKALSAKLTGKEKVGNWNKLHMEVSLDD